MALVATPVLEGAIENILEEIHTTALAENSLTPRSVESLRAAAQAGDLVILKNDNQLVGWGIREELRPGLKEVGLMFINPEFRSAASFILLARELANVRDSLILATYDAALIRQAVIEFGFREASLMQVIIASRGRFVTKRLNSSSRAAVAQHTKTAKPLFAIRHRVNS
jgi:hypothetical protein